MRLILAILALLLPAAPSWGASRSVTLCLDGARVEQEAVASKGYLEIALPAAAQPDSLRIRPLGEGRLVRVELVPQTPERKVEKELALLGERRDILKDRLQALETREEIFKAAAKSQSGKVPRKSKTNPEPLRAVKQGTDFALAQLESVYAARRRAERELKSVDQRLAALRTAGNVGGSVARVWLAGGTRVRAGYDIAGLAWSPAYALRAGSGDTAELTLHALLPSRARGEEVAVSATALSEPAAVPLGKVREDFSPVVSWRLPVTAAPATASPAAPLRLTVRNAAGRALPAGEVTCYRDGEYVGKGRFAGARAEESVEIGCGRLP